MAFETVLRINALDGRGGMIYNYCGTRAGERINYNKDNRIPIFPIRLTGGSENWAVEIDTPARLIPAMQEATRHDCLQKAGQGGPGARSRRRTRECILGDASNGAGRSGAHSFYRAHYLLTGEDEEPS